MKPVKLYFFSSVASLLCLSSACMAQPPGGPGNEVTLEIVDEFDANEDGWLNNEERAEARQAAMASGGNRRGGPGGRRGRGGNRAPGTPGRALSPADVESYPDAGLYQSDVLRTLFIDFENEDWEQELEVFKNTDVEVPATMTVDGQTYPNVGMRFRGASSYFMVPTGLKRSFNVSIDMADEDQRLYGYKTLNLLNSSGDPSFLSTVLYSHIASQYMPVPRANHVHVVVNGESWGIYVNVQQFNKDFLKEHYESSKGTRWKVSGSPRGDGGLRYLGEEIEPYLERFEMKSNDGEEEWRALIELCRTLNETPLDKLESELAPMLDIDGTLRFLAMDVASVNSDGYWTRASDFSMFLDREGVFHIIPHDMNEAFMLAGHGGGGGRGGPPGFGQNDFGPGDFGPVGPGGFGPPRGGPPQGAPPEGGPGGFGPPEGAPGGFGPDAFGDPRGGGRRGGGQQERERREGGRGGPGGGRGGQGGGGPGGGGPGGGGVTLDPFVSADNDRMPLRSRLLAVPELRAKYLQYVREIAGESFDWEALEPVVRQHVELIQDEVAADTRKLDTTEAFQQVVGESGSLRTFFEQRREFLLQSSDPGAGRR